MGREIGERREYILNHLLINFNIMEESYVCKCGNPSLHRLCEYCEKGIEEEEEMKEIKKIDPSEIEGILKEFKIAENDESWNVLNPNYFIKKLVENQKVLVEKQSEIIDRINSL